MVKIADVQKILARLNDKIARYGSVVEREQELAKADN
jgi:hypothetical protein